MDGTLKRTAADGVSRVAYSTIGGTLGGFGTSLFIQYLGRRSDDAFNQSLTSVRDITLGGYDAVRDGVTGAIDATRDVTARGYENLRDAVAERTGREIPSFERDTASGISIEDTVAETRDPVDIFHGFESAAETTQVPLTAGGAIVGFALGIYWAVKGGRRDYNIRRIVNQELDARSEL